MSFEKLSELLNSLHRNVDIGGVLGLTFIIHHQDFNDIVRHDISSTLSVGLSNAVFVENFNTVFDSFQEAIFGSLPGQRNESIDSELLTLPNNTQSHTQQSHSDTSAS